MSQGCRKYLLWHFPSIYLEGQCKSIHISFMIVRFWDKNQIPYLLAMSANHLSATFDREQYGCMKEHTVFY